MLGCPKNWDPWEVVLTLLPGLRRGEEMVGLLLEEAQAPHPAWLCPVPRLEGLPCPPSVFVQPGWSLKAQAGCLSSLPVPPGRQRSRVEMGSKYQGEYHQEAAHLILTWVQILTLLPPS